MAERQIGIIMHGVTGRMGLNQHLIRSILAIRDQGGIALSDGDHLMPDPLIVGRNPQKIERLAKEHGLERWTSDLDEALSDTSCPVFFDAGTTQMRAELLTRAIEAGKHVYCEKPIADDLQDALAVVRLAEAKGIKHGVVQDKLFLPGLLKMRRLIDAGFFGRLLSVRGEFGYWVFEGDLEPAQRPSWNYKSAEGGGIILDMLCHWRYVLDNLFGGVKAVSCLGATHIPERRDEAGEPYQADADDAAYACFELEGAGDRPDQLLLVRPGSAGRPGDLPGRRREGLGRGRPDALLGAGPGEHAEAGLEPGSAANHRLPLHLGPRSRTAARPRTASRCSGRCSCATWQRTRRGSMACSRGAKGVQLAELGLESWRQRKWFDVPALEV